MEALVSGRGLVEGPRWDERDGCVWFTDAIAGGVFRLLPSGGVEDVLPGRRGVGGLALHADGGVVASGRTLVHVRDGEEREVLRLDGVAGFNDLHTDPDGHVLAGALRWRPFKGEEPVPGEVWRVGPGGRARALFGGVTWANGIGLSPDGATTYACDYARACVWAWPGAGEPRVLARAPEGASCDGMAVDEGGGLWVALGQGGAIARYAADGTLEEVLDAPADFVSSVSFGGEDGRDLYVATIGSLLRTRVALAGMRTPRAKV